MGQVPVGIIGDGRMARHFSHYYSLLGGTSRAWSRRIQAAQGLSLTSALAGELSECQTLLVLVGDSAIEPVIAAALRENPELARKTWLHFSGSLVTPLALAAHPLMSFGPTLYERSVYEQLAFICDEGLDLRAALPLLPNRAYLLPQSARPRYHALCVLSGNFSVLLWQKLFQELQDGFGIPREAALPYLRQITSNLSLDPVAALTGPLQRGDWGTVSRNLAALRGDSFQEIYRAFVKLFEKEGETSQQELTL